MNVELAAAVLAQARSDTELTVYDGPAPDNTVPPYVVVYLSVDREYPTRLAAKTDQAANRITTHSVGATADGARIVADRLRTVLLDHRIGGGLIRHSEGRPLDVDESTGNTWWDQIDVWTFTN